MKNYDEKSYQQYKQYRLNKYRYGQEQIIFPLTVIIIGAILLSFWRYLLLAVIVIAISILVFFICKKCSKKQFRPVQLLTLTPEEALNGIEIDVEIMNLEKPLTLNVKIPPKTKNGQKFILRNVKIPQSTGKSVKADIYLTVEIK